MNAQYSSRESLTPSIPNSIAILPCLASSALQALSILEEPRCTAGWENGCFFHMQREDSRRHSTAAGEAIGAARRKRGNARY